MRTFVKSNAVALALGGALALLAVGCKKEKPSAGSSGSGSGSAVASGSAVGSGSSGAAPAAAPGTVEIFVNDTSIAKVSPEQIAKWPRLDTLVPEASRRLGTWSKVKLTGGKTEEVPRPSASYPDMVPALFPGEGGKPAFGMFDPVEHAQKGKPGLRADDIREIRIETSTEGRMGEHQGGAADGADPMKISIAIEVPGQPASALTGAQILALPREPMPGNEDTRGWRLSQLLDAAGIKKFEQLVLLDAGGGSSIILDKKDLDPKKTVPFLKLNKSGVLRVRVMKAVGTGWQTGGELRALGGIKVAK